MNSLSTSKSTSTSTPENSLNKTYSIRMNQAESSGESPGIFNGTIMSESKFFNDSSLIRSINNGSSSPNSSDAAFYSCVEDASWLDLPVTTPIATTPGIYEVSQPTLLETPTTPKIFFGTSAMKRAATDMNNNEVPGIRPKIGTVELAIPVLQRQSRKNTPEEVGERPRDGKERNNKHRQVPVSNYTKVE